MKYNSDTNDDIQIRQLFDGFEPRMSSDRDFMSNLKRSIDAVEIIRKQNIASRRRCRTAAMVAGATGFVMGMLFMILIHTIAPWYESIAHTLRLSMPQLAPFASQLSPVIAWGATAIVAGITAYNAYQITVGHLTSMAEKRSSI